MEEQKLKDEHDNYYSYAKCKSDDGLTAKQSKGNKVKEVNDIVHIRFTNINCDTQKRFVSNRNTKVNMIPCHSAKALYHRGSWDFKHLVFAVDDDALHFQFSVPRHFEIGSVVIYCACADINQMSPHCTLIKKVSPRLFSACQSCH